MITYQCATICVRGRYGVIRANTSTPPNSVFFFFLSLIRYLVGFIIKLHACDDNNNQYGNNIRTVLVWPLGRIHSRRKPRINIICRDEFKSYPSSRPERAGIMSDKFGPGKMCLAFNFPCTGIIDIYDIINSPIEPRYLMFHRSTLKCTANTGGRGFPLRQLS